MSSPNDEIANDADTILQDEVLMYMEESDGYDLEDIETRIIELEEANEIILNPQKFLNIINPTRQDIDIGNLITSYSEQLPEDQKQYIP